MSTMPPDVEQFRTLIPLRLDLMIQFNKKFFKMYNSTDIAGLQALPLSDVLIAASAVVSYTQKDQRIAAILSQTPNLTRLELVFNRSKAQLALVNPTHPKAKSLLEQLMAQVPVDVLIHLKQKDIPWRVYLEGEGATDAGGPGRDIFTEVCLEIMQPQLKLFLPAPEKYSSYLMPNTDDFTPRKREQFVYVGALVALSYITKLSQPFSFLPCVWKGLTGRNLTFKDIIATDPSYFTFLDSIEHFAGPKEEFERLFDLTYVVRSYSGRVTELLPGSGKLRVRYEDREFYAKFCRESRFKQLKDVMDALAEGMSIFIPTKVRQFLAPLELRLLCCGENEVSVAELKKQCRVDTNEHSKMLWEVLERFTPHERLLFIKFATGRMGLPPPGMRWPNQLVIRFDAMLPRNIADSRLPTASTCSSTIVIPPYSSADVMERRLRTAITFGCDIERDHDMDANEVVSLT